VDVGNREIDRRWTDGFAELELADSAGTSRLNLIPDLLGHPTNVISAP
jgi:hypothetical protein